MDSSGSSLFLSEQTPLRAAVLRPRGGEATALRTKPEGSRAPQIPMQVHPRGPSKLGGQWPARPPTRARPLPPRGVPGCHTQGTAARHPSTLAAGLSRDGYTTSTEDFSSGNPVLPGSVWVTPKGPARRGTAGPYPPGAGKTPGQESLPTPPAKGVGDERAATRLFSWGARRHPAAQVESNFIH